MPKNAQKIQKYKILVKKSIFFFKNFQIMKFFRYFWTLFGHFFTLCTPLSQLATTNVAGYVPLEGSTPKVEVKASHRRRKSKMSYDPSTLPPQVPDSHRENAIKQNKARKSSRRAGSDVNQALQEITGGKLTPNNLLESSRCSPISPNALRRKKHSVGTPPRSPRLISRVSSASGSNITADVSFDHSKSKRTLQLTQPSSSNPTLPTEVKEILSRPTSNSRTKFRRQKSTSSEELNMEASHELEDGSRCDVKTLTRVSRSNENFIVDSEYIEPMNTRSVVSAAVQTGCDDVMREDAHTQSYAQNEKNVHKP